ncbi:MAG: redoxin domain-containing protein [Acidobacteriota bacterium]|nr:redoxin domain-containing protein [Acidobacteriota bacterium]
MEGLNIYNVLISFAGGILSFLSPCVFPLVPGYVSMISGVSIDRLKGEEGSTAAAKRAVVMNSLAFNAGISLIFLALGATAGFVGSALTNNVYIRIIGGLVIIAFGLQLIGLLKIGALYKDTRFLDNGDKPSGLLSSFTLGLAFAAGWTPCIGPILGGIIGLAATSGGWQSGFVLSAFYSLGLALPFLLVGLFINQFLSFSRSFKKHLHTVEVISGVLLVAIGLLVASGYVTVLNSSSLAAVLPNWESKLALKVGETATNPVTQPNSGQTESAAKPNFPPAPAVVYENLEGTTANLSELRGQVVLLNLWAKWCVPCIEEIPTFNALQKDYEAQGFKIVGLTYEDESPAVKAFKKEHSMEYTVAVGKEPSRSELYVGLPTTYLIDREGRIRQKFTGIKSREQFEAAIKTVLEEK